MGKVDTDHSETFVSDDDFQVVRERQLTERTLDRDFPKRSDSQHDLVSRIGNRLVSPSSERGRGSKPPYECMSIEQQSHRGASKSSISSSVSSKSGEIQIWPFNRPGTRGSWFMGTGTRRTSGLPFRAIITSSPARARSTS